MPRIIKSAKGSYTAATITVDGSGRVIDASAGAGAANMTLRLTANGPSSGNFDTPANASKYIAYAFGGGGGGGAATNDTGGRPQVGPGGTGGKGFFSGSVSASTTYAYAIGSGGAGGPANTAGNYPTYQNNPGSNGSASNVTNLFTANGGSGGTGGSHGTPAPSGSDGTVPGGNALSNANFLHGNPSLNAGGSGGPFTSGGPNGPRAGSSGGGGHITLYDNG